MGRLFWKILAAVWGALLLGVLLFAMLAWFYRPLMGPPPIAGGPGAQLMLSTAASTFSEGGTAALQRFANELKTRESRLTLLVVDQQGIDLLGHTVETHALAQARKSLEEHKEHQSAMLITSPGGEQYVMYLHAAAPTLGNIKNEPMRLGPPGPGGPPGPRLPFALIIGVSLLGSLAFSAVLAWYFAQPIRHLKQAIQSVGRGHLNTRVKPMLGTRKDELADLGSEFDRMSQQLQSLMQTQQRLLHDVSHELRSPLARLQAAVSLIRQTPARMDAMLDRIELETERLDQLVGEVLTLARLENDTYTIPCHEVDLHQLLSGIADDASFEAEQAGKRVRLHSNTTILLQGCLELLHRAFENVIRNAISHTKLGTDIDITVSQHNNLVQIDIDDDGPGVATSELEQMFDPFFRCELGAKNNGFGLGLAICRRAVAAHGGNISASNRAGGGLRISITLPLDTQAA